MDHYCEVLTSLCRSFPTVVILVGQVVLTSLASGIALRLDLQKTILPVANKSCRAEPTTSLGCVGKFILT